MRCDLRRLENQKIPCASGAYALKKDVCYSLASGANLKAQSAASVDGIGTWLDTIGNGKFTKTVS